ncbi:MAG TPA: GNAT family N-acetyltransferase [Mobilitalea sp.]|nr:GNAT family N-acetyltransferase [Mobilitalea sp.]
MSISKKIRLAEENDSVSLLNIYSEFIRNTAVTFETAVPTVLEFSKRIRDVLESSPWLVCEINGENIGYAYASKHRERSAYQWSVDVTVYINPQYHRRHIATALYIALIELLKIQGYYSAYAGISLPNLNSEGFHESFGFKPVGVFHNVGFKFGEWRDVKWFELTISEYSKNPAKPKTINEIKDAEEFENIIKKAIQIIK